MKANELRIGNLVKYKGLMRMVYEVYESALRIPISKEMLVSVGVEDCQPIELTPEILEKAGFKKNRFYHILTGRGDQTTFSISWDGGTLNIFDNGFEMSHGVLLLAEQSKYLHQLQNLYFSLTGEELEINLNP